MLWLPGSYHERVFDEQVRGVSGHARRQCHESALIRPIVMPAHA